MWYFTPRVLFAQNRIRILPDGTVLNAVGAVFPERNG